MWAMYQAHLPCLHQGYNIQVQLTSSKFVSPFSQQKSNAIKDVGDIGFLICCCDCNCYCYCNETKSRSDLCCTFCPHVLEFVMGHGSPSLSIETVIVMASSGKYIYFFLESTVASFVKSVSPLPVLPASDYCRVQLCLDSNLTPPPPLSHRQPEDGRF